MRRFIVLLSAALLTACQPMVPRDENYPYYHPPAGSTVVVNKPIDVPPGRTRTFFQNGEIIPYNARNRFYPNCEFEILTLADTVRTIRPGEFRVTRVIIKRDQVAETGPRMVAGLSIGIGMGESDGPGDIMHVVEMRLKSTEQPDVYRLVCRGGEDNPADAEPPTINEMRRALGDYATLKLPPETP